MEVPYKIKISGCPRVTQKQEKRRKNVTALYCIMTTTQFLINEDGNFRLFLELTTKYVSDSDSCMRSSRRRIYLSYENQNEILKMLADHVVRDIVRHLTELSTAQMV